MGWFNNAVNAVGDFLTGDFASGIAGLFGTGYNMYTNQRDYDYQRALQQEVFDREDTAVQRRKKDLEASGFNPALAMGQAAGAGSVVSRSNTNDINTGAYLDYINAAQQIKSQKVNNRILGYDEKAAKYNAQISEYNAALTKHQVLNNLGLVNVPYIQDGHPDIYSSDKIHDGTYPTPEEQRLSNELYSKIWDIKKIGHDMLMDSYYYTNDTLKTQLEKIYKQYQMNETTLNNVVNRYCELLNLNVNQEKLKLELSKLDWNKEKFGYEMLAEIIVGLTQFQPVF